MVEALSNMMPAMVRPTTATNRPAHQGAPVVHNYMRDDLT